MRGPMEFHLCQGARPGFQKVILRCERVTGCRRHTDVFTPERIRRSTLQRRCPNLRRYRMRHYLLTGLLTAKNDGGARGLCLLMLSSPVSGSWGGLSTGVPHGVSRVSLSIRWIFHRSSDNFLKLGRKFANTIQCGGSK